MFGYKSLGQDTERESVAWQDADTWVQQWSAIELLAGAVETGALAIVSAAGRFWAQQIHVRGLLGGLGDFGQLRVLNLKNARMLAYLSGSAVISVRAPASLHCAATLPTGPGCANGTSRSCITESCSSLISTLDLVAYLMRWCRVYRALSASVTASLSCTWYRWHS